MPSDPRTGTCGYCGTAGEVTRDHIFARSFFPPPLPNDPYMVDACRECQEKKAKDETPFRDFLVMADTAASLSSEAEALRPKVRRALSRNRSPQLAELRDKGIMKPVVGRDGKSLGRALHVPADSVPINEAIAWMVRGLIGNVASRPLPDTFDIIVNRYYPYEFAELRQFMSEFPFYGPCRVGDAIRFWYVGDSQDEFSSLWVLGFYDRAMFSTMVAPRSQLEPASSSQSSVCTSTLSTLGKCSPINRGRR